MIKFTPHKCTRIHELFREMYNNPNPKVGSLIELLKMFNTYDVRNPYQEKSFAYWEFLHACLDNISSNTWRTLPRMWIEYCCHARESALTDVQVEQEYKNYLFHREKILKSVGLSALPNKDKEVILYWVRNKKSEQYILGIAHTLLRIQIYFAKVDMDGLNNNVGLVPIEEGSNLIKNVHNNAHNDAELNVDDQSIWARKMSDNSPRANAPGTLDQAILPLEANSKLDLVNNTAGHQYAEHEEMI